MDCKDIKQIIPKYFKHTATDDEIKTVEEHLCTCHNCRTALGELMDKVSDSEDSQSQKSQNSHNQSSPEDRLKPGSQEKSASKAKKKQKSSSEDKTKDEGSGAEEMEYFPGVDLEAAMGKLKETPVGEEKEESDELLDEAEKEEKDVAGEQEKPLKEKPEYYTFDEEPKPESQENSQKQDEDKTEDLAEKETVPLDSADNVYNLDEDGNKPSSEKDKSFAEEDKTTGKEPKSSPEDEAKAAGGQKAESAQEEKAEQPSGDSDNLSPDALKSSLNNKEQASEQEEEKPVEEKEPPEEVRPDYVIEDEQSQPPEQNEPSPKEDKTVVPADGFEPQAKDETLEPAAESAGADEYKEPETAPEKQENIPSHPEELKPSYESKEQSTYSLDGVPIGKGKARFLEYICLIAGVAILGFFIFLLIKG
ncbi:MAG: zf-HC2 domain-containing protein [Omnitrophica bacterium]|nr:zf-HC2 domain-containing protein [Candidatus Omnitrophota bacterium]